MALAHVWTPEERRRLLECSSDDELSEAFPGRHLETLKKRRREFAKEKGPRRDEVLGKVADLIERGGLDLDDVDRIEKIRLNEWDGFSKDADGNPVKTPLEAAEVVLRPKGFDGPAWPVVQPAAPVRLPAPRERRRARGKWRTAVILPDPQIGYRRDLDRLEELDPFHDEAAMRIALAAIADLEPDLIVNLGDFLDLAEVSRWVKEPAFQRTTQPALDRGHRYLAEQRAAAPDAEIRLLEGNHEARLPRWIMENAGWAFGIRPANLPDHWPSFSIPALLRLDEIGVEYVPGYPAGITWINDRLACIHGSKVRSSGSTAAAVIDDERVSVIFGHVHRIERQHKTRRVRQGARSSLALSPGCLCRIDGVVPSGKMPDPLGRPVKAVENWQQGFAVVTYRDGDSPFSVDQVAIHDGFALMRGEPYTA